MQVEPKSYNLDFRWIAFTSSDGIPLKGWYIPAEGPARGTIIYCHGLNRTRIEMLPHAVFGHSLGYNSLLFDFRHQGASGGDITTLGYQERLDVLGAVHYALEQEPAVRPIVAWGVSMGASAALMAAAEAPDTIEDYRETASAGLKRLRGRNGHQPGDPARAAAAIIQAVSAPEPPLRLLLGKFALANARKKVQALQQDFEGWAKVSEAADFPADQA